MTTLEVISKLYGINTFDLENPIVSIIGTTPVQVLPANPGRLSLFFQNLSVNAIYVSTSPQVSSSNGILVSASGGSISFDFRDDLILPTRQLWAVASGVSSNIYVSEIDILL